MSFQNKNMAIFLSVAVFFVILDRFLKIFSLNFLSGSIPIIGNWLKLNFIPNYFISFSIPLSGLWLNLLIVLVIIMIAGCINYLIFAKKEEGIKLFGLTIVFLGAISNILDRFKYGFVIDYIDFRYFTVFNLADVMITAGIILIVINFILNRKQPYH